MSKNGVKTALRLLFYELWAIICFSKNQNRIYYCNFEKSLFYQWNGFTIVFMNQKSDTNWKNTLLSFLPINVIFSLKCACISSTIFTFLQYIQLCFATKIPKKLIIPQNATIIQDTLLTFFTKKVILPQYAPAYGARFWLFGTIIHCVFTPKTPRKLIFPQIVSILQGIYWLFFQIMWLFPQNAPAYRAIFKNTVYFYNKNSQKDNLYSNFDYNIGHFIYFSTKKMIISSKCICILSTILTFCPITKCVFTTEIPKKLNFPQIASVIQRTLPSFLGKKVIFPQNAPAYRARFWFFA